MAWTTPKTDWSVGTDPQNYNGDIFTNTDFNRIMNNIRFLYEYAEELYPIDVAIEEYEQNSRDYRSGGGDASKYHYFYLYDGYTDRTKSAYVYADEINYFEERLHFLNKTMGVIVPQPTNPPYYNDNGVFIDATELNRLESLCETLQPILYNMFIAQRKFAFTLSQKNNHIDL